LADGDTAPLSKNYFLSIFLAAAFSLAASAREATPSFACRGNLTLSEKLICTDPDLDLQWLDWTMAEHFKFFTEKVLSNDAAAVLRRDQIEWLALRDSSCGITAASHPRTESEREPFRRCLIDRYQKRNRALRALPIKGASPAADEVLAILNHARSIERSETCPTSREFNLDHYIAVASVPYARSPIFYEIPLGLETIEDQRDYRMDDVDYERPVPSARIPEDHLNRRNPFHGLGDSRMRISCRVRDSEGQWWVAYKDHSDGAFLYLPAGIMRLVTETK
jgi:uncharacterized protein YecT (DUF1311 family)